MDNGEEGLLQHLAMFHNLHPQLPDHISLMLLVKTPCKKIPMSPVIQSSFCWSMPITIYSGNE